MRGSIYRDRLPNGFFSIFLISAARRVRWDTMPAFSYRSRTLFLPAMRVTIGLFLGAVLFASLAFAPAASAATPVAKARTVVSIEFDDGWQSAYQAGAILANYGMTGTFFIISGFIGTPDFMTWSELHTLANGGNEIAGHTINHPTSLATLSTIEQQRQVCNDRVNLINQGFVPTDMAYPDGAYSPTTESIAKSCGYNSARSVAGVLRAGQCTQNPGPSQPPSPCVNAETIPPLDPYATRTPGTVESTDTPAMIESLVTQAQNNGGGWVQIAFHQICNGVCAGESDPLDDDATPATLNAVAAWLATQASVGTVAEPMNQVIGGSFQPAVSGPPAPAPGTGTQLLQNGNLKANTGGSNVPDCFQTGGYGTNNASFTWSPNGPTGSAGETVKLSSYTSGDAELITSQDQGSCSPSVTVGQAYEAAVSYTSTVPVEMTAWYRNTFGNWVYWASAPNSEPASSGYSQATFVTPPVPTGATALSFGLLIDAVGSLTTGNYSLGTVGSTSPPSALQNPLLTTSSGGIPTCWQQGGYGTNATAFSLVPNGPAGGSAEKVTMSSYTSGDAKLVVSQSDPTCAPSITPGTAYTLGASYQSTVTSAFVAYYETAAGGWVYWTSGPDLPAASAFTPATFTTPPAPSGAIAISFGLLIDAVGSLTTGNYSLGAGA